VSKRSPVSAAKSGYDRRAEMPPGARAAVSFHRSFPDDAIEVVTHIE